MKSAVIVFPGSNRDRDMIAALDKITGRPPVTVWHGDTDIPPVDLIVLPGGFSYGDYLRSGAIAARAPIMPALIARAEAGVPVLGVCNGFQILCEAGLLPGVLMRNASLRFVCREVHLRVETTETALPASIARATSSGVRLPMATATIGPTKRHSPDSITRTALSSATPTPKAGRSSRPIPTARSTRLPAYSTKDATFSA